MKPLGREARSPENRVNQAWKPGHETVEGEDVFGNKKTFQVEVGHFRCCCGNIVRVDKNGYAACEECGLIYNDGFQRVETSNREKKRALERFKYDCLHKDDQSGRSARSAIAIDFSEDTK